MGDFVLVQRYLFNTIALGYPSQDRINNYISGRAAIDQILVIKE
jgi:hypothetical protein